MTSFERFTERARQVVVLAQEEARKSRSTEIEVPHLVGGLLREEAGLAAQVLNRLGVPPPSYADLKKLPEGQAVPEKLAFSDTASKALELALREALSLGHNYIGTEHILLGVLREEVHDRTAPGVSQWLPYGMIRQDVREAVMFSLSGTGLRHLPLVIPDKPKDKPASVLDDLKEARGALDRAISALTGS